MTKLKTLLRKLQSRVLGMPMFPTAMRLPHLARRTPRKRPGRIRLAGYEIHYVDLLSLYIEYKDIFVRRIYHFGAEHDAPFVVDGGGCIGMATLYFKKVYPKARILCFEPDEALCKVLRRNLDANRIGDVRLIQAGLSDETGTATFQGDGADGGRIAAQAGDAPKTVRTVRLSDYIDEPVDFLKLNVEGEELPILREMEAAGKLRKVRELVVEYHGRAGGEQRLGAILELLDRNGFRYLVHDFDAETNPATKPPFLLTADTTWFCLVYAKRIDRQEP